MPTYREDLHLGHEVPLVETDDIRDGAITTEKISDGAVTTPKIADEAVTEPKIKDGSVTGEKIKDASIGLEKLSPDFMVTERMIKDQAVTTDKIQDDAVSTPKIADLSVTTPKIADENITEPKLADGAVTTDKLAPGMIEKLETLTDFDPTPGSVKPLRSGGAAATYGHYIENPEFLSVVTDNEDKILVGLQSDGNVYFGKGCPQQVIDYVQAQIDKIMGSHDVTEAIDSVKEIIAFLEEFKNSETLAEVLAQLRSDLESEIALKEDKVAGKSLIDKDYAEGVRYLENPEFVEVKLDSEDRILEAIMKDGTKLLPAGLKIPSIDLDGAVVTHVDNPEFVDVVTDANDRILYGVTKDGDFIDGKGNIQKAVEAGKLGIKVDSENGILTIGEKRYKLIAYED